MIFQPIAIASTRLDPPNRSTGYFLQWSFLRYSPLLFLLLTGLISCGSLQSPEFKNVDNIRVEKLEKKESILLVEVRYYNPNKTRLQLKSASGEAWIDGQSLGTFRVDSLVQVPARGDFSLPVTLKTELGKLLQHSFSAMLGREVQIKLKGKARVGKGFIFINYPIEYEGKTRLDQLTFDK